MSKKLFRVDLTKIGGEGDFPCPKCGNLISPDDETENAYTVIDTIMGEDDCVEGVVIRCNRCDSTISLGGFAALSEEGSSRVEVSEALPESRTGYRTFHTLSLDGRILSQLVVEYAQKEDVEAFKRLRNLHVGEPFKATITIEGNGKTEPKSENLQEIVKAVKKKFKGLRGRDIYVVEIKDGQENFMGRASNLQSPEEAEI